MEIHRSGIITPEEAYVLGFLWADGSTFAPYRVFTEIVRVDAEEIMPVFLKTGKWTRSDRERKNRQPQTCLNLSDKDLVVFLNENGYKPKDPQSPTILSKIPKELHYLWLRGVIDGDGCWYVGNQNTHLLKQFTLSNKVNQDWNTFIKLFNDLGIIHTVGTREHKAKDGKISNSSLFRVTGKTNLDRLVLYVYQDLPHIGLSRKREKAFKILETTAYADRDYSSRRKASFQLCCTGKEKMELLSLSKRTNQTISQIIKGAVFEKYGLQLRGVAGLDKAP